MFVTTKKSILVYLAAIFVTIAIFAINIFAQSGDQYGIKLIDQTAYVVGTEGMILKTTDFGTEWYPLYSGVNNRLYSVDFRNDLNVVVCGENGTILISHDGGKNWKSRETGLNQILRSVKVLADNVYIICGDNGIILKSSDFGDNWYPIVSKTGAGLRKVFFVDAQKGYIVGENSTILKSFNGGDTWFLCPSGLTTFVFNSIAMIDENNGTAVGPAGLILNTNDGGLSWFEQTGVIPSVNLNDIVYIDNTTGIIVGDNGLVMKTTDAGLDFFAVDNESTDNIYSESFYKTTSGLAVGQNNAQMYSYNGGNSWYVNSAFVNANNHHNANTNNTGRKEKKEYAISQNYPNPFNPTTMINYSLPFDSKVSIKVYDLIGREVNDLVNEFKQSGNYSISFNASSLTSGVYFYRILATSGSQEYSKTMRMTLIK